MRKSILLLATMLLFGIARADEGMWLPYQINKQSLAEMQSLGLKLSAEQIFDLNQPSLKDAILQFGGGCTAEIISPEGLVLTNHHCGLSFVQKLSSIENDYLKDGFWAYDKSQELPNPTLSVLSLTYVEDVTDDIMQNITDNISEMQREELIAENMNNIIEKRKGERNVKVEVVPFYSGNQFILFEYNEYKDVRLVVCPPWGIGKYGADTDNWTWPRHKGDFMMFRVYTAPDGSPAEYSKNNVPLKPRHYLPINIKGVKPGDYAMILGYPGSTDRYSTSHTVKNNINEEGPAVIKTRTTKLDVYRQHMDADPEVFIQYASKQASVSNYWKYYIGQVKQLQRNKIYEKRLAQEEDFKKWATSTPKLTEEYGNIFEGIDAKWEILDSINKSFTYHREAGWNGGEAVAIARRFIRINKMIEDKADKESIIAAAEQLRTTMDAFFKDYSMELDRDVTTALLNIFYKDIPANLTPTMITEIGNKNKGDFSEYVSNMFKKSIFTSQEKMNSWLDKPKSLKKDPIFALTNNIIDSYNELLRLYVEAQEKGNKGERKYMKGLMEMQKDRNFYPDANFTMRLTYGTVEPYKAADAVNYNYYTTMDGVMAKYIPGNWEFDIPQNVIDLYNAKDYGKYADENGDLVVNFITTNDITGGNSGSPVIDGEGNLIGLAFDGNWEAMSGDLSFENKVQRTICMDSRYLFWVIEKVGKAQNLIDEMVVIE